MPPLLVCTPYVQSCYRKISGAFVLFRGDEKKEEMENKEKSKKGIVKIIIFVAIVVAIFLADRQFGWSAWISNSDNLAFLKQMVNDNIVLAFVIYCAVTIVGCVVLALPGLFFALLAGVVFGPVLGIVACDVACTLGAMGAFIAGRYFLKDSVKPLLKKSKTLERLLFSGSEKNDLILLMITRMVPIFPYNLQNFAYGITDIDFAKYSIFTFLFMIPGVSFFTIGAAGLTAGADAWIYYLTAAILAVLVTIAGLLIKKKFLPNEEKAKAE